MRFNLVSVCKTEIKMGTYTTNLELYKPSVGEQGWGTMVNENFDKIDAYIPGVIQLYAGSTTPNGWLICNGQAVSRTTYAALYAVIGTTYGAGDGSTTFNVPNLVNKTVRGSNSLGKTGGADTVTLSTANMPAHSHGTGSLTAASNGAHNHYGAKTDAGNDGSGVCVNTTTGRYGFAIPISSAGEHTHTITGETSSVGSGSAVTITNPYIMLHYIIKT